MTAGVASLATTVHVVLPDGVDDPARPSGGNRYDRRVCAGLAAAGWDVREAVAPGSWPRPGAADSAALTELVTAVPDGDLLLVDGLVASAAADVLVPQSHRVRMVVLVHLPLGEGLASRTAEHAVLACACAVVTTSAWTRRELLARYPLCPHRVHVARPGADVADPALGTPDGGQLLCVAAVTRDKGQDVLLDALRGLPAASWRCTVVGSLDRDPPFVAGLRLQVARSRLGHRVRFLGPRVGTGLLQEYRAADLFVVASRAETYGMVVTEALGVGLPVLATAVGGVPEALGRTRRGLPGVLLPPGDHLALTDALAHWLRDPSLRRRLRRAALERRGTLEGWDATTRRMATVLAAAAAEPAGRGLRVTR